MELDRLVVRPSVEHVIELESSVVKQQDERVGGTDALTVAMYSVRAVPIKSRLWPVRRTGGS